MVDLFEQTPEPDSREFKKQVRDQVAKAMEIAIRRTKPRWQFDQTQLDLGLQYLGDDPNEAQDVINDLVSRLLKFFPKVYRLSPKRTVRNLPGGISQIVYQITPKVSFNRGRSVATFAIYYDSRKGLEKRGITVVSNQKPLPEPFPASSCPAPPGWAETHSR